MLAVVWPFGFPSRFADSGGAQTRCAQTVRAFFPVSATLLGHTTRPGKIAETMNTINRDGPTRGAQIRPVDYKERPTSRPDGRRRIFLKKRS